MTKTHRKEIEDLRFENAQIKETVEAKERLIDDLSMANEDMLKQQVVAAGGGFQRKLNAI